METKVTVASRVIFIVFALIAFSYVARAVVLPVMLAWVVAMTLKPTVSWLAAHHLPTPLAAGIVVGIFVVLMSYAAAYLISPAISAVKSAPQTIPQLKEKFHHVFEPFFRLSAAASKAGNIDPTEDGSKKTEVNVKDNHVAGTVFTWTGSLLAGIAETLALIFLLLASGDFLSRKLVNVMSTTPAKKHAAEISREIQESISKYLFSVGLINVGFGTAVGLTLIPTGMSNVAMWGGIAAFLNFIPYFGPVIGMILVGLGGFFAFDSIGQSLLPAGIYLALHLIEANLVTPFILGKQFTMNPFIIFTALIFFVWLWGVIGALLAVPLLISLKIVSKHVPALSFVEEYLSP